MADAVLLAWSLLAFVPFAIAMLLAWRGTRAITRLEEVPAPELTRPPLVSIVVAAKDEARAVEGAVRSLLALDWPALEVVAVDDRSTDGTGEILDRLAAEDPRLAVVHVTALPGGWLGKNHALQCGAERARGTWLLFTDGDVIFHPMALRQAVALAGAHGLDHLTVGPEASVRGFALQAAVIGFGVFFGLALRPWKIRDPRSDAHAGIGAFNMVRTEVYRRAGGHTALALRPDDDLALGKWLKRSGARQELARGERRLRVEWYRSLGEMAAGLEKNTFAALGYSVPRALGAAAAVVALGALPVVGAVVADGPARVLFAATYVLHVLAAVQSARAVRLPAALALLFPGAAAFLAYVILRSTLVTLRQGGIRWRGTFYPLAELRKNRV